MAPAIEALIGVLVFLLVVVSIVGVVLGVDAYIAQERFERCPSCGRRGLTVGGSRHPNGCRSRWRGLFERAVDHLHHHRPITH